MHWIFGGIFHRFPELPLCNSLWYFASETLLALVSLDSCPLREFLKFGHFLHLGCAMAWSFKIVSWGNHGLTLFSEFQGSLSIIVWFLKTIVTRVMCKFFFFFLSFSGKLVHITLSCLEVQVHLFFPFFKKNYIMWSVVLDLPHSLLYGYTTM